MAKKDKKEVSEEVKEEAPVEEPTPVAKPESQPEGKIVWTGNGPMLKLPNGQLTKQQ